MAYIPKSFVKWLEEHAQLGTDGKWRCKKTGEEIKQAIIGRSIWTRPFLGGSGEVRRVVHPFCKTCDGVPDITYGEHIYEDELTTKLFLALSN